MFGCLYFYKKKVSISKTKFLSFYKSFGGSLRGSTKLPQSYCIAKICRVALFKNLSLLDLSTKYVCFLSLIIFWLSIILGSREFVNLTVVEQLPAKNKNSTSDFNRTLTVEESLKSSMLPHLTTTNATVKDYEEAFCRDIESFNSLFIVSKMQLNDFSQRYTLHSIWLYSSFYKIASIE